jgi:arginine decarboxylase
VVAQKNHAGVAVNCDNAVLIAGVVMSGEANCLNLYNVERWGEGYFSVDTEGFVCVHPDGDGVAVRLLDVWDACEQAGLRHPVLLRFSGILRHRVKSLANAFNNAMAVRDYTGRYTPVYPIKVNQQRRVVSEILKARDDGQRVGLEAGSKPELMAVLALSQRDGATIVCNGYKDQEYIRLALMGEKLGFQVHLVVEKLSELNLILAEATELGVSPRIGLRVRLMSIGKGNWQNTGGEKSKFGLSASQLIEAVDICRAAGQLDALCMLHFHLGSQIANISDIHRGMQEAARYYQELRALGAGIHVLDVGGGLGVDYEGTRSRSACSMNYDLADYAGQIVGALKACCDAENLPMPDIISESGRALSAHHALLLVRVIDQEVQRAAAPDQPVDPRLIPLWQLFESVQDSKANLVEIYQELLVQWQTLHQAFLDQRATLSLRAAGERIYVNCQLAIRERLDPSRKQQRALLDELNEKLADKLFVNFSLFQSIPDVWGIDQIFPILPLAGLDKPVGVRAVLQDITCDSDGRVDWYVDGEGLEATLPLPEEHQGRLGIFMVGAYQEILGDMHNLFGDTDAVDVEVDAEGHIQLNHAISGDTVSSVLRYVNFEPEKLLAALETRCHEVELSKKERQQFLSELREGLEGYTYLE